MTTAVLIVLTVWTITVLARSLRSREGWVLTCLLLVLALPSAFSGGTAWRVYLLAALAWHLLLSFPAGRTRGPFRAGLCSSALSLAGTAWLLITGGPSYWLPVVIALAALLALWCLHLWFSRRRQPAPAPRPVRSNLATRRSEPAYPAVVQPRAEPHRRPAVDRRGRRQ